MKQNFTCHLKTTILAIIFLLSGGIPANSQYLYLVDKNNNSVVNISNISSNNIGIVKDDLSYVRLWVSKASYRSGALLLDYEFINHELAEAKEDDVL